MPKINVVQERADLWAAKIEGTEICARCRDAGSAILKLVLENSKATGLQVEIQSLPPKPVLSKLPKSDDPQSLTIDNVCFSIYAQKSIVRALWELKLAEAIKVRGTGINLGDVAKISEKGLKQTKRCGRVTINEITSVLKHYGMNLTPNI